MQPNDSYNTPPDNLSHKYVLPETTALAFIGSLDLLYTVYLIATGQAVEANHLMKFWLDQFGPWGFCVAKMVLLAIPLCLAEYAKRKSYKFVRSALRICILLYTLIYLSAWLRLNG